MLILNFPGLMQALEHYVASRVPEPGRIAFFQCGRNVRQGEEAGLRCGGEELRLGLSDLTRVALGAGEEDYPREKLPGAGPLAQAAAALFPLPAISPGLNYV